MASISFLGATGTVTGSKFVVEHDGFRLMVDCGLFQGLKDLRLRNWSPLPISPSDVDMVVLTHAHIDHTGYLPVLIRDGFDGPVLATPATCDLCGILLPDCGHIQEEDARWANKRGYSKHKPALPLYTQQQAEDCLGALRPVPLDKTVHVNETMRIRLYPAGHILGASMVEVVLDGKEFPGGERSILFSGDLGRPAQPIIRDRVPRPPSTDVLVMESTYGNRDHPEIDPKDELERIIRETVERGGMLLIPAFAVGRTQSLLYLLRELQQEDRLPRDIPIHVDSPMAIHTVRVFMQHPEAHDLEMRARVHDGYDPLGLQNVHLDRSVEDSKAINNLRYPAIVISASGMATAGRILHHLTYRLPDHRNTVLFVGFQAAGTRGRHLQDGARTVRIHGREIPVRARVETLDGLSAHADRDEMMDWLSAATEPPKKVFLVHGEPTATGAFADTIRDRLGWKVHVPEYEDTIGI
jgi:metallo-beta-lactamase family protein